MTPTPAGPEERGETEPCPTCMQPVPVPQRGDHDYGLPLIAATPAPDTGAEERLALLRIFDMAEDRPDIRSVARAALHDAASSGTREEGT